MAGLVAGALLWYALRYFKKGRGSLWLLNACYWYLPAYCFKSIYKTLPESAFRLYLK
ncbi:type IV conjugative transfer system protein TraL [Providencia alcalifaciens]